MALSAGRSAPRVSGGPRRHVPSAILQIFKGFVREVEHVALVDEHVICHGGEHHGRNIRGCAYPAATAVASDRSAASDERVSMNLRYQPESRSISGDDDRGSSGERAGRPRVSSRRHETVNEASVLSAGSRNGQMLDIATSTVRPVPPAGSPVTDSEPDPDLDDLAGTPRRRRAGRSRPSGDQRQRDALLEPLLESPSQVLDLVPRRFDDHATSPPERSTS